MNDGGKGSARRPTDHKSFSENFDRIFGKNRKDKNPDIKPWFTAQEVNLKEDKCEGPLASQSPTEK